jgi:hypothetical protein
MTSGGPDAVPHWCQHTEAPELKPPWVEISDGSSAVRKATRSGCAFWSIGAGAGLASAALGCQVESLGRA